MKLSNAVLAALTISVLSIIPFAEAAASHTAVDTSTRPMARPAHIAALAQPDQDVQVIQFLVGTKPEPRP